MNVGHCIHGLGIGGAQRVVRTIVERRTRNEFEHSLYSPEDGVLGTEIARAGARVRIIPRCLPRLDPVWVTRLARAFRKDRIDVVHTHLFGDSLHGYLAARRAGGLPMILTLHARYEVQTLLQRAGYRWLLARDTHAVACSRSVRESFLCSGLFPRRPIGTIVNGIDDPFGQRSLGSVREQARQRLELDPRALVIASVGRLDPQKGYSDLIRAFSELLRRIRGPVRLLLLGEGPLRGELAARVRAEGVEELVTFAGFRPDVADLMPGIDILAFSSISEGLSIAMLEAMAASVCIVGTDVPGILEAVRPDREALIVPPRNAKRLADALECAAADPALRARLGAAARRRFLESFTCDRMVAEYETQYRRVLEAKCRGAV